MRLAVIPARGGSKRIPRKNIRLFCGKPIIAYSIECALQAERFDEVLVSTDDEEIAQIARKYGATTPFLRPQELADDFTGTNRVIAHALQWCRDAGYEVSAACGLYATAPLLRPEDIQRGLMLLQESNAKFVVSVASYNHPIERALRLNNDGELTMIWPEHRVTRSQDLPTAYHDAGQMYWGRPEAFLDDLPLFASHSRALVLPRERVQDIDTLDDWQYAEILYRTMLSQELMR